MARRAHTYAIRLAIEGSGQVKAELVSVGQSGKQSLKRIESAGEGASGGMRAGSPIPSTGSSTSSASPNVQRSDGWITTTWNNMSDPAAFAAAAAEEQEGEEGEPPPLAGAGVVVCLMG